MFTRWSSGCPKGVRLALFGALLCLGALGYGCGGPSVGGRVTIVHVEEPTDDFTYLAGYGEWIDVSAYGLVWRPYVVVDWRPFKHGRWVWSDDGWTWVSYEPYGWLVYHYGDWHYDPAFGWLWRRGSIWRPAPVVWVVYGDFICWAPAKFHKGNGWEPWRERHWHHWNVIRKRDMDKSELSKHYIKRVRAPERTKERVIREAPVGLVNGKFPKEYRPPIVKSKRIETGVFTEPAKKKRETDQSSPTKGTKSAEVKKKTRPENGVSLKRIALPDRESRKAQAQREKVQRDVLKGKPKSTPKSTEKTKKKKKG